MQRARGLCTCACTSYCSMRFLAPSRVVLARCSCSSLSEAAYSSTGRDLLHTRNHVFDDFPDTAGSLQAFWERPCCNRLRTEARRLTASSCWANTVVRAPNYLRSSSTWACSALSRPSASASLARAAALWSSRSLQSIGSGLLASERPAVLLQHCGLHLQTEYRTPMTCHSVHCETSSLKPGGRKPHAERLVVCLLRPLTSASRGFSCCCFVSMALCMPSCCISRSFTCAAGHALSLWQLYSRFSAAE